MEAVLVTRDTPPATDSTAYAPPTTSDLRLTVELQSQPKPDMKFGVCGMHADELTCAMNSYQSIG